MAENGQLSSSSKTQNRESNRPWLRPSQVLQLLSQYGYTFTQHDWRLKPEFLKGKENLADNLRVVIFAVKEGQEPLRGIGQADNFRLAGESASMDLVDQLRVQHGIPLPEAVISYEARLSPKILDALTQECYFKEIADPVFEVHDGQRVGHRACSVRIGKVVIEGWGMNDMAAKCSAAYKMYEVVRKRRFPLGEIQKGNSCVNKLGFECYDLIETKKEGRNQLNHKLYGVTLSKIPTTILASLKASCPLTPTSTSASTSSYNKSVKVNGNTNNKSTSHANEIENENVKQNTPCPLPASKVIENEKAVGVNFSLIEASESEIDTKTTDCLNNPEPLQEAEPMRDLSEELDFISDPETPSTASQIQILPAPSKAAVDFVEEFDIDNETNLISIWLMSLTLNWTDIKLMTSIGAIAIVGLLAMLILFFTD